MKMEVLARNQFQAAQFDGIGSTKATGKRSKSVLSESSESRICGEHSCGGHQRRRRRRLPSRIKPM